MTRTMSAALIREWGGPEVVEVARVDRPLPGPGDLLVRVEACSINYLDILVRRGVGKAVLGLPHVPGSDIVGIVEAAGDDEGRGLLRRRVLVDPAVGRGVVGGMCWGGLAEYVVVPVSTAIPLSPNTSKPSRAPAAYAALPMAYGTARHMLFARAGLAEGESILILGAAGGVGAACVQLGRLAGARVIACSTSDAKLRRLTELGAESTINVATEDLVQRARSMFPAGVDVIVDFLGAHTWGASLRCARAGGRIATCGSTTGPDAQTDLRYLFGRELTIVGSNGWSRSDIETCVALLEDGLLDPPIHGVFPLSSVREAVAELEERRAVGKVIVVPDDDNGGGET